MTASTSMAAGLSGVLRRLSSARFTYEEKAGFVASCQLSSSRKRQMPRPAASYSSRMAASTRKSSASSISNTSARRAALTGSPCANSTASSAPFSWFSSTALRPPFCAALR